MNHHDSIEAQMMAEKFVKKQLKAPSTAQFASVWQQGEVSIVRDGQTYIIRSWVDAENSFGALLRMEYVAELEQIELGRWRLHSLVIDE